MPPPKQVYGKRAPAATAAFAKFILPDQDVVVVCEQQKKKKRDPVKTRGKERDVHGEEKGEDAEELEVGLGALTIANEDADVEKGAGKSRRAERGTRRLEARKAEKLSKESLKRRNGPVDAINLTDSTDVEDGSPHVVDLTEALDGLTLDNDNSKPQRKEVRKGRRSNKAPKSTSETKKENKVEVEARQQRAGSQQHALKQTPPSSPVRSTLRAVVIPRRTASPTMPVLPTPDKTPEPEDPYTTYVSSLLSLSDGKGLISFDTWASALEPHFEVTKIAEASYSEVYRLTATSKTSGFTNESVLKLIPLKTPPDAPLACQFQERQTRDPAKQLMKEREAREEEDAWKSPADDVRSEVKLLQNLNHIPGFTQFRELTVLQGRPSASFNSAWKAWNSIRPRGKKSQFPDPGKKASYPDTQLWAVVEMQDAGTDCEKVMEAGGMSTIWEVWDVFWGVCLSVAKAEEACKFEHRDLHLENICIRSSRLRSGQDLTKPVIQEPLRRKLGFTGLDTTVIDYTLSRADILPTCLASASMSSSPISMPSSRSASQPFTPPSKPEVAHLDLDKDMSLFAGDASEEYQYEIYRYMRGVVFHGDPLHPSRTTIPDHNADVVRSDTLRRSPRKTPQHIRFDSSDSSGPPPFSLYKSTPAKAPCRPPMDPWRAFQPKTNLVWAHFILHQLLAHIRETDPRRLSDNQIMQNVKAASEDTAKVAKKARGLYKVLDRVRRLLEPRALAGDGSLESVKELVVLAIEERWLRVGDVAGY